MLGLVDTPGKACLLLLNEKTDGAALRVAPVGSALVQNMDIGLVNILNSRKKESYKTVQGRLIR